MNLRLLLDEDTQAKELTLRLRNAGYEILTVEEAGLGAAEDIQILEYARRGNWAILTRNCADFLELHEENPEHSGILVIYQGADLSKNMRYAAIIKALDNFMASGLPLERQFYAVNAWNF